MNNPTHKTGFWLCALVAVALVVEIAISQQFNLPASKSVATICALASPFCYAYGYYSGQRFAKKIGVACAIVSIIMWFMSPALFQV